jgi:hypothetical protein
MVYFREVQRLWSWVALLAAIAVPMVVAGLSIHFQLLWAERAIPWSEIRGAEAVTYSPGSRGVRSTAYNVSGNRGVRIESARNGRMNWPTA